MSFKRALIIASMRPATGMQSLQAKKKNWNIASGTSWTTRRITKLMLPTMLAALAFAEVAEAQTFNSTTGTSPWNVAGSWTPSGFPNATGASAIFNSPTAAQTVNLTQAITVGSIDITNNSAFAFTLANGGGSLTMDATGGGPATIIVSGTSTLTNNATISASISLIDSLTFTNNNTSGTGAATATFTGTMTGLGGFTKTGSGRLSLSTLAKAYTGSTLVDFGRFRMTGSGQLTGTASIHVNSGGSLYLDSGSGVWAFGTTPATTTVTINGDGDGGGGTGTQGALRNQGSGTNTLANPVALGSNATIHTDGSSIFQLNAAVSGSALTTLTKSGGGTLQLVAANASLLSGTTVQNGTVLVNAASNLGTGALALAQTAGNNTSVTLNNASQSIGNLSSTWTDTTGTLAQTITLNGTALTINQAVDGTFGTGAVPTLTSIIAGTGSISKAGSAKLTLSGTNTYTGTTNVSAGMLVINGSVASPVNVQTTGTLGGNGTVGGLTTILDGTLAPGNSAGTLTFGAGLTLNSASSLNWELNPLDTTIGSNINDLVAITGNFTLDGTVNIAPTSGSFSGVTSGTWTLATYTGGTFFDNTLNPGTLPALDAGYNWSFAAGGGTVTASITPGVIPEPSTLVLGSLGLLGLAGYRLRRRRQGQV